MCELPTIIYLPTNFGGAPTSWSGAIAQSVIPTPGPCNSTRDVWRHPTWQERSSNTKPHWGQRLCESEMPARVLRGLRRPRVVLVWFRGIRAPLRPDLLGNHRMAHARYSCRVWRRSDEVARACGRLKLRRRVWLWLRVARCHTASRSGHRSAASGFWL